MLNTLLGGKFTSRINLNLRERHGYTYGATTRFSARQGPGPFIVAAAVETAAAGAAAREVLHELRRIRETPVEPEELAETHGYLVGVFPYSLQTIGDVTRRLETLTVYGLPDDYYERYLERIAAVTREEIQEAAAPPSRSRADGDRGGGARRGPGAAVRGDRAGDRLVARGRAPRPPTPSSRAGYLSWTSDPSDRSGGSRGPGKILPGSFLKASGRRSPRGRAA